MYFFSTKNKNIGIFSNPQSFPQSLVMINENRINLISVGKSVGIGFSKIFLFLFFFKKNIGSILSSLPWFSLDFLGFPLSRGSTCIYIYGTI